LTTPPAGSPSAPRPRRSGASGQGTVGPPSGRRAPRATRTAAAGPIPHRRRGRRACLDEARDEVGDVVTGHVVDVSNPLFGGQPLCELVPRIDVGLDGPRRQVSLP
jgi:hypothetical protein